MATIIPEENLIAYQLLYQIEVGMRELIISTLSKSDVRWWKKRLPADVLEKYKNGRQEEQKIKWVELIPHHPLYYVDFPDIRKVIDRNDNWKDIFQNIFGDKDVICGTLRGLEPVRNNIAHNRKASSKDLQIVQGAYSLIVSAIGESQFVKLVQKCTTAEQIPQELIELSNESEVVFRDCASFAPCLSLHKWESIKNQWWFDSDYLGTNIDDIISFFELLTEYNLLPRYRGEGYKLEEWFRVKQVDLLFQKSRVVLTSFRSVN